MIRILTCFVALLAAMVLGLEAPIPGYRVEELVWGVDVYGNGTIVNITGPVEKIYHTIEKLNPSFVKNISPSFPKTPNTLGAEGDPICGPSIYGWEAADVSWIEQGIAQLRDIQSQITSQPGPGACTLVSCSWDSAIWWCNDKKEVATLDGFHIADCAQKVLDKSRRRGIFRDRVVGQNFEHDDWNCVVRQDVDNCWTGHSVR